MKQPGLAPNEGAQTFASGQPVIMPIIVNPGDGRVASGGGGVDLGDVHKLKDMIS